jgi:hypothetical protein
VFILAEVHILHTVQHDEFIGNVVMLLRKRSRMFIDNFPAARNEFLKFRIFLLIT